MIRRSLSRLFISHSLWPRFLDILFTSSGIRWNLRFSFALFSPCFSFGLRFHYFHLFSTKSNLFRFSNVSFRFRYNRIMWWTSIRFHLNFPSAALFLSSRPAILLSLSPAVSWVEELEECLLILAGVYVECTLFLTWNHLAESNEWRQTKEKMCGTRERERERQQQTQPSQWKTLALFPDLLRTECKAQRAIFKRNVKNVYFPFYNTFVIRWLRGRGTSASEAAAAAHSKCYMCLSSFCMRSESQHKKYGRPRNS